MKEVLCPRSFMSIELKGLLAGLAAALVVLSAAYGVSALVTSREGGKAVASASSSPMSRSMRGMSSKMTATNAGLGAAQLVATGRSLFTQACSSCHGGNALGGYGPNLHGLGLPNTKVATVIRNGVKGKMPAYGGKYSAAQQDALVTYVQSL